MHISLNNESPLILAFEKKRKELGFTTCTSAVLRAIEEWLLKPAPAYASPPEVKRIADDTKHNHTTLDIKMDGSCPACAIINSHDNLDVEHKEKIDAICIACSGSGEMKYGEEYVVCPTCHGKGKI